MDLNKVVDPVIKLIRALTWKRVALSAAVELLAVAGMLAWMNREYLAGVIQPSKLSADSSPLSMSDLKATAADTVLRNRQQGIMAVVIASINAPANTRKVIYFKSNDAEMQSKFDRIVSPYAVQDVPLFTANTEDNRVLIRLINGELVCRPWGQSISSKYLHDVNVKTVCAVGIPPEYGRFRGIVMVYLSGVPDEDEMHRIRILLRNLSFKLDGQREPL